MAAALEALGPQQREKKISAEDQRECEADEGFGHGAPLNVARGCSVEAEQHEAGKAEAEKNHVEHGFKSRCPRLNQRLRAQRFDWEMRAAI